MTPKKASTISHPIAIIGMGCIFPESRNLKEYWHLLFNGVDAIKPIPEASHWQLKDYYDSDPACPDHTYCTRGGFIPQIPFNPLDYGIPPNNIQATDTSQLLGLEVARMALADAGYPIGHDQLHNQKVNVILGVTGTQELVIPLGARLGHPLWKKAMEDGGLTPEKTQEVLQRLDRSYVQWQENSFPGLLGNVVAGRIANRLNLSGTNAVSDAACASSLSAIHTAVMELQTGRCDMSITGGVDTLNDIFMHMCFSKTGVLSHTSDAKPFSKDADGTVLGEGIGMLVLKRLADAERDKDRIYAVIRGIGTSSDGRTSAVYAPEAKGQIRALEDAYNRAGIDPGSVELVEAHGTGTRVGDKVEFSALKEHFKNSSGKQNTAIGSVKSMIGHAKAAAGAAGIIKVALALHHKVIPPTLKAGEPDPELEINSSAFYLNDRSKPWIPKSDKNGTRCSGVSAFGFGGSNFHAVLEEYQPEKSQISWDGSVQIIAVSAPDKEGLDSRLAEITTRVTAYDPGDASEYTQAISWQAYESRKTFSHKDKFRVLILVKKEDDFAGLMEKARKVIQGDPIAKPPVFFGINQPKGKLGFVFPGQGSQYTGMARDLISLFPQAMEALALGQSCMAARDQERRLSEFIFPLPGHVLDKGQAEEALRQTDIAQPAIGSASLAMTDILRLFGVRPDMTCGHSFGELSALHAAGWLDRKDFLELAVARGRHMAAAGKAGSDPGSMLAVQAPIEKIQDLIDRENLALVLANKNSHNQGVLSGSTQEIDKAYSLCKKQKMRAVKLPVAAAFHSPLVENASIPFKADVAEKRLTPTPIEVLSNTTGKPYPRKEDQGKALLGSQLMHPVNFIDNVEFMHEQGVSTFIEIGPKSVLTGLINAILKEQDIQTCAMDGSAGKKPGVYDLGIALSFIAAHGYAVDLTPWEEAAQQPETKRMKVMLNGANPKPTREQLPPVPPQETAAAPVSQTAAPSIEREGKKSTPPQTESLREIKPPSNTQGKIMTSSPLTQPTEPGPSRGNMDILEKGLEAMQQLQAQTARAHEKFLETQTQAGKTLAMMMEQTRSAGQAPLYPSYAPEPRAEMAPQIQESPEPIQTVSQPQPPVVQTPKEIKPAPTPAPRVEETPNQEAAQETGQDIQVILFDTVSKLTGFPVEMLEQDMDIESDLGIDSIKKVEIISELEKQIPDGQGVTPEHLTTVRTLGDICRAMGGTTADTTATPLPPADEKQAKGDKTAGENQGSENPIFTVLVTVISELTGFPKEMLEPEMNLESDLGIDSIKRVEILSKLEQELSDIQAISPDEMGVLKTIEDIVHYLSPGRQTPESQNQDTSKGSSQTSKKKTSHDTLSHENRGPENQIPDNRDPEKSKGELLRQEVVLTPYPVNQIRFYNGTRIQLPADRVVYLTRDGSGIADRFKEEFNKSGIQARLIDIGSGPAPDLSDAAGLVIVPDAFVSPTDDAAKSFLLSAFDLTRKNAVHLMAAAREKGSFFTCLGFSGGGFGFDLVEPGTSPIYGGLAGLAKTAGLEWPDVLCRALDMPADPESVKENAEAAVALMMTHGAPEMGIKGDQCVIPTLASKPVYPETSGLGPDDLVVITGGAKGVTAECALALARACGPKIVLLGRSPAPFEEASWIRGVDQVGEMKKAILANAFEGKKPKPAEVEKYYQSICSNREIRENINRIKAVAETIEYHSVDIRNKEEVSQLFTRIEASLGPVTAVIHGAGVLEDKLITEKKPEQFQRVFNTKVEGLEAILGAVDNDKLRYLVLFSSIAARLGNPGQSDYAMANEVLNKIAQARAISHPHCRVVSINWGPWDGGMVNDALKREFSKRGVDLIPLEMGADQLVKEMSNPDHGCVEVVIGGTMNPPPLEKKPVLNKALTQTLGVKASPIITHHRIDNTPVVPFALMADLMACGTEKNNPGLRFAGIDQMRLLKGITTGQEDMDVQVNVGKCVPRDGLFLAPSTLTSAQGITHASAEVLLTNSLPEPPVLSQAAFMDLKPSDLSAARAYDEILFHRGELQSIIKINGVSPKGIEVITRISPRTGDWYEQPQSRDWTIDPLMLDAAFQAAILWTHETRSQVCLPSFFANLRLYRSYPAKTGDIRILFTVNHETRHKVQGYFTFLDETDTVIASIMGFEAFIDPGLKDKFKPRPLFDRDKILAFAQGNPSEAFGEPYKIFDKEREIARLPRPPYFFMDAVVTADHTPWEMVPGGWIESTYQIPESEWYFTANRTVTLPFCILLEIALQPCGWLAAYAGSALKSDDRLHFRNLGGNAKLIENLALDSGTLTVRARMSEVSQAGGMIIQDFEMEVLSRGQKVYQGTTNFGFFTTEALANQVGIRNSRFYSELPADTDAQYYKFESDAPITPDDTDQSPNTGMPSKALRMIDEVNYLDFEGGVHKNGCIQALKQVDAKEWFFDAHFYQDPVCPGSLGVESFLQMLRFFLIKKYGIDPEKYQPQMTGQTQHKWIYRGQITPKNSTVLIQAHVKETDQEQDQYTIVADGSLTVDGICIYEMENFSIQFVPADKIGEKINTESEETADQPNLIQ